MHFVPYSYGGRSPRYNYNTKYTSPLRVFDNFNSKAKTLDVFNFAKIKNSQLLKASRPPLTQSRVLPKENTVKISQMHYRKVSDSCKKFQKTNQSKQKNSKNKSLFSKNTGVPSYFRLLFCFF